MAHGFCSRPLFDVEFFWLPTSLELLPPKPSPKPARLVRLRLELLESLLLDPSLLDPFAPLDPLLLLSPEPPPWS